MLFLRWISEHVLGRHHPTRPRRTAAEQDTPLTQSPSIDSIHSSELRNPSRSPQLHGSHRSSETNTSTASNQTELRQLPTSVSSTDSNDSQPSSDQPKVSILQGSNDSSAASTSSYRTTQSTIHATPPRPPIPSKVTRMHIDRGRFPAVNPKCVDRPTSSPESEALANTSQSDAPPQDAGPSTQSTRRSEQPRKRSDSISPPRGYVAPPRDHPPPPPTLKIPEPPAGLEERQAIIDGYIKSLAQKRNDSNFPARVLVDTAEIMARQLKAQREWLNPKARLTMSLPSWFVIETADAQDHLLRRMRYTGWVNRGVGDQPQQWMQGVLVGGPGNAARAEVVLKRRVVSPFEYSEAEDQLF